MMRMEVAESGSTGSGVVAVGVVGVADAPSSSSAAAAGGGHHHHHHHHHDQSEAMAVYERVARMASGNAVVVFSASGCCMCHVVKRLLLGLGVGPTVYELDQMVVGSGSGGGREIQAALAQLLPPGQPPVPVVFVGGRLLGGVEKVMACHINGTLVPLLKQAGALWL